MDKEKVIEKISKGEALTDSKELLGWVNQSEENQKTYIRYKNLWALLQRGKEMDTKYIEEGLRNVKSKINRSNKRFSFINVFKYAAIIVVALIGGFMLNTLRFDTEISMNEINVPKGNRTSIVLPDSTKVWINNDTKFKYPSVFSGNERVIELTGEAYFEVKHDPKHPFIVKTGHARVKVIGTKFIVSAYPDDDYIETYLISGNVHFQIRKNNYSKKFISYNLNPGYSLNYNKNSGKLIKKRITSTFYNYWMNGIYEFNDESLESLANKIYRIYNTKIIFENDFLKHKTYTGTLSVDDNIFTFIEAIKRTTVEPIEYRYEKNKIYIKLIDMPM